MQVEYSPAVEDSVKVPASWNPLGFQTRVFVVVFFENKAVPKPVKNMCPLKKSLCGFPKKTVSLDYVPFQVIFP